MTKEEVLDKEKVKVRRTGYSYALTIPNRGGGLADFFKPFREAGFLEVSVVMEDGQKLLVVRRVKE